MSERHRAAVAAYLILRRGDEILLTRRQNTGWHDGWYGMPAGKVEVDELPVAGLMREAREEIGVDLDPEDISFAHAMYREHDGHDAWADYIFLVQDDAAKYTPTNAEPEKCDDLRWFPVDQLPINMIPNNRQAVEQYIAGVSFSAMTADASRERDLPTN